MCVNTKKERLSFILIKSDSTSTDGTLKWS